MTLNDTSVTKFERNKLINKVFGNSIKNTFKTYDVNILMKKIQLAVQRLIMDMKKNLVVYTKGRFILIRQTIT